MKLILDVTDSRVINIAKQVAAQQHNAYKAGDRGRRLIGDYNLSFWIKDFEWPYPAGEFDRYVALIDKLRASLIRNKS